MSSPASDHARVVPLRPGQPTEPAEAPDHTAEPKEPLWRDVVGEVLRNERLDQDRTLKDVADAAGISMPYLSEIERGRKEASSELLAAAAHAVGLDLADLLALSHRRLVRLTRANRTATKATSSRVEARASVQRTEMSLAA